MLLDIMTGVAKVVALWWKPTSQRFTVWLISKVLILIVPMVLGLTAKWTLGIELNGFIDIVLSMLVLAESYSVLQNIVSVRQRKHIEEYDALTSVLTWSLQKVKDILDWAIKKE